MINWFYFVRARWKHDRASWKSMILLGCFDFHFRWPQIKRHARACPLLPRVIIIIVNEAYAHARLLISKKGAREIDLIVWFMTLVVWAHVEVDAWWSFIGLNFHCFAHVKARNLRSWIKLIPFVLTQHNWMWTMMTLKIDLCLFAATQTTSLLRNTSSRQFNLICYRFSHDCLFFNQCKRVAFFCSLFV